MKPIPPDQRLPASKIRNYFKKEGWRISVEARQRGLELSQQDVEDFIQGGLKMNGWSRFRTKEQIRRIQTYTDEFINKLKWKRGLL